MTPENMIWVAMALPLLAMILIFLIGEKAANLRESCTIAISIALFYVTSIWPLSFSTAVGRRGESAR